MSSSLLYLMPKLLSNLRSEYSDPPLLYIAQNSNELCLVVVQKNRLEVDFPRGIHVPKHEQDVSYGTPDRGKDCLLIAQQAIHRDY